MPNEKRPHHLVLPVMPFIGLVLRDKLTNKEFTVTGVDIETFIRPMEAHLTEALADDRNFEPNIGLVLEEVKQPQQQPRRMPIYDTSVLETPL